jgi:hypothetical protein
MDKVQNPVIPTVPKWFYLFPPSIHDWRIQFSILVLIFIFQNHGWGEGRFISCSPPQAAPEGISFIYCDHMVYSLRCDNVHRPEVWATNLSSSKHSCEAPTRCAQPILSRSLCVHCVHMRPWNSITWRSLVCSYRALEQSPLFLPLTKQTWANDVTAQNYGFPGLSVCCS